MVTPEKLTDSMGRCLARIALGKEAQVQRTSLALAVFGGLAVERGLARTVKHRDHTRTLQLTDAGRVALDAWNARARSTP